MASFRLADRWERQGFPRSAAAASRGGNGTAMLVTMRHTSHP